MKKLVTLMLVVLLVLSFVGCSKTMEPEDETEAVETEVTETEDVMEKPTILFLSHIIGHPVYVRIEEAFQESADELGFEAIFGGTTDVQFDKMIEEIEIGIAEGIDGIVLDGSGASALVPVLEKAKEKGIPVATYFIDVPNTDLRCSSVMTDSNAIGYQAAKALHEQLGGADMKLGFISGSLDAVDELAQRDGAQKYCDENEGCEIITTVVDKWDSVQSEEAFHNLLAGYPEVNAVFGTNGVQAVAFAKALEDLGLDANTMPTITMDDVAENIAALQEGRLFGLMAQDFYAMGYLNGKYVYNTIMGEGEVEKTSLRSGYLITIDNIDTYLEDWLAEEAE
jgi:ribose transport system substrate-binding protein